MGWKRCEYMQTAGVLFFQPAVFSHYSRLWRSQRLHAADRPQTQPEQSMNAPSAWRKTPHEREQNSTLRWPSAARHSAFYRQPPRCHFGRPRSTSFRLPAGGRNSPLIWINKFMVWTRIQSNSNLNDQYLPYLDETGFMILISSVYILATR